MEMKMVVMCTDHRSEVYFLTDTWSYSILIMFLCKADLYNN